MIKIEKTFPHFYHFYTIILQMQNSCFYLFCFPNIPEVFSQIATCSSCNIHLALVFVVALWTFPFVVVIDDYTLEVSGIELSKNQVEDLFLRDPITGKKYVVVGDEVIEVKE